ncbi:MAG: LCP family protein, partial [Anaerolineales bacterium]|nr:LCP family protein [Anaerolineales bacterium]
MKQFEFLKKIKLPKLKRPSFGQIIFWGIALALAVGGFILARNMTACWTITKLPGVKLPTCSGGLDPATGFVPVDGTPPPDAPPTPEVLPEAALPPAWDGASRINILFFGLDYRDWEAGQGPPRSDTMILFTVDPVTKQAGMLSIPRDMWVNIPGFGYGRINMAYPDGEGAKLPGGGAGLAMKTVEQFIGVPVHYYAQVDFNTFAEFIDYIGGVDVWVEETLRLDPVGPGQDKFKVNCCGYRHMNGWRTLAYARTRKTKDGDIDRAHRQQLVIAAIQKKVFDPQTFPKLIQNAPAIYAQFQSGIHTNMALEDAIKLAVLGKDVSLDGTKMGVIDTTMVTFANVTLGGQNASVMKPLADKIRVLRDEIFTSGGALSPMAVASGSKDVNLLAQAMRAEEARVRIVDGTFTPGLDQRAGALFQSQGMNVTEVGPANEVYSSTIVVMYG